MRSYVRYQTEQSMVSWHPGRAPRTPVAKLDARVLNLTLKHLPRDGSSHWSSRKLAADYIHPINYSYRI